MDRSGDLAEQRTADQLDVAIALWPAENDCRCAARPASQLRRCLLQHAARSRFGNSGGSLHFEWNQRVRRHGRGQAICVQTRNPQRIEQHARAGGAVDHRDCSAGRFRLELRVVQ
jgi:hypothetical protein